MGLPIAFFEKLGGKCQGSTADLPGGFGRFAIVTDPGGNHVGLWA